MVDGGAQFCQIAVRKTGFQQGDSRHIARHYPLDGEVRVVVVRPVQRMGHLDPGWFVIHIEYHTVGPLVSGEVHRVDGK